MSSDRHKVIPAQYLQPEMLSITCIYYETQSIRIIKDRNSTYVHAADLGTVVERKSNISRMFCKFESPSEKVIMKIIGTHNYNTGQPANILTKKGVERFLTVKKMNHQDNYKKWIEGHLLPYL